MGLLEDLAGGAVGKLLGGGNSAKLVEVAMGMLGGAGGIGGLSGLLSKFQGAGLKDQADSWVSTGGNQEITADHVTQALGHDEVSRIANEAGVSHEEAAGGLAKLLPELIDKLTPDGNVPDQGGLLDKLGGLGKLLG
ncbi:MAG: YidB family protein [Thermoleophilia bacterium]